VTYKKGKIMKKMLQRRMALKAQKGKKGFTLVEVIVVLVIIAILAAVAIPSLTGYIDKANQRAAVSQATAVRSALQTIGSEGYKAGVSTLGSTYTGATELVKTGTDSTTLLVSNYSPIVTKSTGNVTIAEEVRALTGSSVPEDGKLSGITYDTTNRTVSGFVLEVGGFKVTYTGSDYTVAKA
jgi:prepilin-type N-terminal cleavage/methylation domain-containing protein